MLYTGPDLSIRSLELHYGVLPDLGIQVLEFLAHAYNKIHIVEIAGIVKLIDIIFDLYIIVVAVL